MLLLLPQAADQGGRTATEHIQRGRLSSSRVIAPIPWTLLAQPVHKHAGGLAWHGEELADQLSVTVPQERVRGLGSHTGQLMGNKGKVTLGEQRGEHAMSLPHGLSCETQNALLCLPGNAALHPSLLP